MPTTEAATADPKAQAGLLTGTVPVPLEGVSVHADVTGECARVTITQRYRNQEAQPIEAVYVFPLDEGAAVCGFEAVCAGVHYVGEVKPRDEAFKIYDEALEAGHGAYLLDEERPDVFTASVGNVPPGGEVLLKLTCVTELVFEGEALRFTLPTTVSPRYAPHEDRVGVGRPDAEALNPPVAWSVPYGLDLSIDMVMPGAITRVESPSHPLSIVFEGSRAKVSLSQSRAALDRDVVVLVEAEGLGRPHALVERDATGQHTAALVFRPAFDVDQAPSEVVFLVDRSGSMGGTSIAEVRNALQLCLRSLLPGSRFDIVGFGSTFASLFKESVPYDERTLATASAHVAALDADLGGTEILPALDFVLGRPRAGGLPRQVVVLTDGEVTNTDAVIARVRQHASDTRVFTFGIGRGASAHLVRGMARAGNGAAEFIYPGERAEAKVLRQFARVLAPALTDVTIDWGGLDVRQAPPMAPAVFGRDRVIVYGVLKAPGAATATLSARGAQGPVSFAVPIDPSGAATGTTLATLAARTLIRDLEESPDWLPSRGSKQLRRKASRVTEEIIRLATTYGLASRETSFVAVERRATPLEGEAVLRRIPVALTSGWGGLERGIARAMLGAPDAAMLSAAMAAAPDVFDAQPAGHVASAAEVTSRLRGAIVSRARSLRHTAPRPPAAARSQQGPEAMGPGGPAEHGFAPSSAQRPLDRLVALQRADGSWELTKPFADAVGIELSALTAGVRALGAGRDADRAWATAVALAWLQRHASGERDEWVLLARKAERWLTNAAGDADTLLRWRGSAEALLA